MISAEQAVDRVVKSEGGYVNNPKDPGGETNYGITWPTLHQAIGAGIVSQATTIASLTRPQACSIYLELVWKAMSLDQYPGPLAFQVLDFAVNSGPGNAVRALQRAAGVADDGRPGPLTLAAVRAANPVAILLLFIAEREDFLRKLSTFASFGAGWVGRAAQDLRYAAQDLIADNPPSGGPS